MKPTISLLMGLALLLPLSVANAEEQGSVSDKAFWCTAALAHLIKADALPEPEQRAALNDLMRFEAGMQAELEQAGWTQERVEQAAGDYMAEVEPQIADYLRWKDPSALRYDLGDCFPNATF